ncbi:Retrovirus-related Pol poly from transposon [Paramuricea clavata]|uniref:Retrovirus-related Pol poly from transposon n=1 Tax=Paramuricea clavata TaxID=317549 RepID=A0A6S7FM61_PARCT|nr:Retrovirus-related Pol poly from transposon [Paramuricea clavata]
MNENELSTSENELPKHLHSLYDRSVRSLPNEDEQRLLSHFLCENSDVFSKDATDIGQTNVVKHNIFTGDHPPIKQQARWMPRVKREEAGRAVDEMLKGGIKEPSTSPWSSPIILVRKKNGTTRFFVDYRKLNNITRKDSYPLPRIDDTMGALQGATWFSTLDLKSGYWQVQLSAEAMEKTAFSVTGLGHWQFKVMPFGLCNAPATFKRLIEHMLAGLSWKTNESDRAFKKLKEVLCSVPILVFPREGAELILDTDASGESVGAVLSQKSENGDEKVIAYYSKVLSETERQYCVTRRELLAVVQAVSHLHCYLYGQHFQIRTDHSALQWLLRFRHLEGQVVILEEILEEYDFRIEFCPGKGHQNADAMSRRPCVNHNCKHCDRVETRENIFKENKEKFEADGDKVTFTGSSTATNLIARIIETENELIKIISKEELRNKQLQDPHIGPIMRWLAQSSQRPEWGNISTESEETKVLWAQWDSLTLRENILYRVWETLNAKDVALQLVVPKSLRDTVLRQSHDCVTSGHFGISKTLAKVKQGFYWIGCRNDVKTWCKQCDLCNSRKGPKRREKLHSKYIRLDHLWNGSLYMC